MATGARTLPATNGCAPGAGDAVAAQPSPMPGRLVSVSRRLPASEQAARDSAVVGAILSRRSFLLTGLGLFVASYFPIAQGKRLWAIWGSGGRVPES